MSKPNLLVVSAAIINSDNRVLLASRPPGKDYEGCWETPGGKVEPGETPEAAIVRELHEELGIHVHPSKLRAIGFASVELLAAHLVVLLYGVDGWSGEMEPRDGQSLEWVRSQNVVDYDATPGSYALRGALLRFMRD